MSQSNPTDPPQKEKLFDYPNCEERARALLLTYLSPQQRQRLETDDFFYVKGSDGFFYAILGSGVEVVMLDNHGEPTTQHEIWPSIFIPREGTLLLPNSDTLLANKLLLETDAELLHQIACEVDVTPGDYRHAFPALTAGVGFGEFLQEQEG